MKLSADLIISGLGTEEWCGDKTAARNLAHLIRVVSYNADFNEYIAAALRMHDMPQDPKMNWAAWLDNVFRRKLRTTSEEKRDEALHEVLSHHLFERDLLGKFDPTRLPEKIQERPLAEQISSYLKVYISFMVKDAIRYLKKTYPASEISMDIQDAEHIQHGDHNPDIEEVHQTTEIQKLRAAFSTWCRERLQPKNVSRAIQVFDVVLSFDGPRAELVEELSSQLGIPKPQASSVLYRELPKLLRSFAASKEGKGFSLIRRIRHQIEKHEQPAPLEEELTHA